MAAQDKLLTMSGRLIRPRELTTEERVEIMRSILEEADEIRVRKSIEDAIQKIQGKQQGTAR